MPAEFRTPGVHVEELLIGAHRIAEAPTSICAFVGRTARGPVGVPVQVSSFGAFEHIFGGLWAGSSLGHCVSDYFSNGGSTAIIVRLFAGPSIGSRAILRHGDLVLVAADPGTWGNDLRLRIDHDTRAARADLGETAQSLFNLTVHDAGNGRTEIHRDVTVSIAGHPGELSSVLAARSELVRVAGSGAGMPPVVMERPDAHAPPVAGAAVWDSDTTSTGVSSTPSDLAGDGGPLDQSSFLGSLATPDRTGLYALDDVEQFNLLVIPPYLPTGDVEPGVVSAAHEYCRRRRAVLLVDSPSQWRSVPDVTAADIAGEVGQIGANAALYFPRITKPNPIRGNQVEEAPACGAVAGVLARTDAQRGVWKAPAGVSANLWGVTGLALDLRSEEIGNLNPLGVNCLRADRRGGPVIWGARTAVSPSGADGQWSLLPVRRTALFLEQSLLQGTRWAVFEPNDQNLWSAIRESVEDFMGNLFRRGAFRGNTAREAYFVRCDRSTTSDADVQLGVVNVLVGFAPLKPAEFVVLRIQQSAGGTPPAP